MIYTFSFSYEATLEIAEKMDIWRQENRIPVRFDKINNYRISIDATEEQIVIFKLKFGNSIRRPTPSNLDP